MPPLLVDSHCHLDDERFAADLPAVIARAKEAGIGWLQTICTTRADFDAIHPIALGHEHIFCSYGIHPHHAADDFLTEAEIIAHGKAEKVIGVGETGLDYYYDNAPRARQQESFARHIRAARVLDVPVIIHTRDADDDTISILTEALSEGPVKALFHCFSSSERLALWGIEKGMWFSASGIVTFKKSDELRTVFKKVPLDRLLVETDAPYLAPTPHRGQRCEPAFVAETARQLADVRGEGFDTLAERTTENFFKLFHKAQPWR